MHLPPPPNTMKNMPSLTTADIAFVLCTSHHRPNTTPRRTHPVTLQTDYGLLIRLHPSGSVSAGLAAPPIPPPVRIPATPTPAPAAAPPLPSSIDEILHTPLTPGPSPGLLLLDPLHPPPSSFFSQSQPRPQPQLQPQPKSRQRPPPPPPPPAQQFKYLLAPSLHDPGASYLWYVGGGWPGNPAPAPPPAAPDSSPPERQLPRTPPPPNSSSRRRGRSRTGDLPPPHPVPEATLATRYHPSWFHGYLDWAERLEASSGSFAAQMDEGERVLWTVEGLLLACWLSLQGDVAGVEYRPDGAEARDGRVCEVRGGDLGRVLDGLFGRGDDAPRTSTHTH